MDVDGVGFRAFLVLCGLPLSPCSSAGSQACCGGSHCARPRRTRGFSCSFGGVGTACFLGRLARPLSLFGAVLWGMTMASAQNLVRSGWMNEPETNPDRQVCSVDVLGAWPPRGPVQRSLVRDQSGRKWVVEGERGLTPGTQVLMVGRVRPPSCKAHEWDFDEAAYLAAKGVFGVLQLNRVLSVQRGASMVAVASALGGPALGSPDGHAGSLGLRSDLWGAALCCPSRGDGHLARRRCGVWEAVGWAVCIGCGGAFPPRLLSLVGS